jgi:tripartite-type tricarboxylate transporter receptor subunit TctC
MPPSKIIAAVAAVIATSAPAMAQDWPARPLTMVIPFAAGGAADVLGRILAPALSEALGRPVVIENIGGAGGMTGAARVAKAAPDGYQFVLGGASTHAVNQSLYKAPLYNAASDFTPVALIAEQPLVLVTRKSLPVGTLREFITYAKEHQGTMQYGSGGVGSTPHLACALLNSAIGVNVTHVPYRGIGPAMQEVIAGRMDYACPLSAASIPQIEAGQVTPIAMLTKERSPFLPSLATAHEQGLADFEASTWNAIFLPKGAPAPIVAKLHDATVTAINSAVVQERLKAIGATVVAPARRSPDYLQRFVVSEVEKWGAAIRSAGVPAN